MYLMKKLKKKIVIFNHLMKKEILNLLKKVVCNKKFIVQLFGRNEKGESVSVSVTDFTPTLLVKIFQYWEKIMLKNLEILFVVNFYLSIS